MSDILISVVIPVYNVEKYLSQCIDSVLHQTYHNTEILLIDDGSTDKSGLICDQYAIQNSKIRVIHNKNKGVSAARNTGLKAAQGEYVIFMDSDDYIEKSMYEEMLHIINKYRCDLVICDCVKEFSDHSENYTHNIRGGFYDHKQLIEEYYPELLITKDINYPATISNCLCMFKKSILNGEVCYKSEVRYSEDWLFGTQIVIRCNSLYYMKEKYYYHYRMNPGSATHKAVADKWKDYSALYDGFVKEFSYIKGYDFKDQLDKVLLFLVYNSVGNIYNIDLSFKEKYKLIREILNDSRVRKMFQQIEINRILLSKKQKLLSVIYKYKIGIPFVILYFEKKKKDDFNGRR